MKSVTCFLALLSLACLFSCKTNDQKHLDTSQLSDSTSFYGLKGDDVKLIKKASIDFKVANVEQSVRRISSIAQKYGGAISNQNLNAIEENRRELKVSKDSLQIITVVSPKADLIVRVPSENLEPFMYEVAEQGYFTSKSLLSIDDKSLAYLENNLKQKAKGEAVLKLNSKHDSASISQNLSIKEETIQQLVANKTIASEADYSTVSFTLFQNATVKKEMVANTVLSEYNLAFGERLSNALSAGWEAFLNFILALLHLWLFILTGILLYIAYRIWFNQKKIFFWQKVQACAH